jgi:hypothetical protein
VRASYLLRPLGFILHGCHVYNVGGGSGKGGEPKHNTKSVMNPTCNRRKKPYQSASSRRLFADNRAIESAKLNRAQKMHRIRLEPRCRGCRKLRRRHPPNTAKSARSQDHSDRKLVGRRNWEKESKAKPTVERAAESADRVGS